jgi:DNA-binding Xre family transcriptional regulator
MTVNFQKLEQVIVDSNLGKKELAKAIGIDRATFYRKMHSNGEKFTVGEMHKMIDALNMPIDLASDIFLFQNSQ